MSFIGRLKHFRVFVVVIISICFLVATQVKAAWLYCRGDPVVILDNGFVIDFGASVSTFLWNVEEVHYELHGPVGTNMIASVHTPTWLTSYETFTYFADQPPGEYRVIAKVETRFGGANVIVDATLVSLENSSLWLAHDTGAGQEGEKVMMHLKHWRNY